MSFLPEKNTEPRKWCCWGVPQFWQALCTFHIPHLHPAPGLAFLLKIHSTGVEFNFSLLKQSWTGTRSWEDKQGLSMCPGKRIQSQGSNSRGSSVYLPLCCPEGLVPFLASNCFGQWDIAPTEQMTAGNIVPLWICCILHCLPCRHFVSCFICQPMQINNLQIKIISFDGNSSFESKKLQSFIVELLRGVDSVFWDGIIPIGNVEIKCWVSENVSRGVLVAAEILCHV